MQFDREKYRHHIAHLGLSQKQEDDIMDFIHMLALELVSQAFGKHPLQHHKSEQKQNHGEYSGKAENTMLLLPNSEDDFCLTD